MGFSCFRQKKCKTIFFPKNHIFSGVALIKKITLLNFFARVSDKNKTFVKKKKKKKKKKNYTRQKNVCTFQTKTNKKRNKSFILFFLVTMEERNLLRWKSVMLRWKNEIFYGPVFRVHIWSSVKLSTFSTAGTPRNTC